MLRNSSNQYADLEEVRSEVDRLRRALLRTVDPDFDWVAGSRPDVASGEDVAAWHNNVIRRVVANVAARASMLGKPGLVRGRVKCPLCQAAQRDSSVMTGFALPTGLEQHLGGVGAARECAVMEALRKMAIDYVSKSPPMPRSRLGASDESLNALLARHQARLKATRS